MIRSTNQLLTATCHYQLFLTPIHPGSHHDLGWRFQPSEKYESQLGSLFPTEWKKKGHVPVTTNQDIDHH